MPTWASEESYLPSQDSAEVFGEASEAAKHSSTASIYSGFDDPNLDDNDSVVDEEEDSPYPEVRCAVANADDPDMPVSTVRAWTIGLLWSIVIPGLNQFFVLRYPSIGITGLEAQLLSFLLGRLWARFVPAVRIYGISMNPGPFTIKEHVLITVMAVVTWNPAYGTIVITVQRVFYNQTVDFIYQWMIVISTQLIGFSMGGICQRFLVQPPSMIWPGSLVNCALFNTLHSQQYAGAGDRRGISRERFFAVAFAASLFWYFMPGYVFKALGYFSWVCWIVPGNIIINQLFGYESGLGMSIITFDWSQIAYIGSPLVSPWWATANVAVGFIVFFWILTPVLYYTNTWYSQYMPISSLTSYDNTAAPYNVTRIINADMTFNEDMYTNYSPLFLPAAFALSYALCFAAISSTVTHTILYYRKYIWQQAHRTLSEESDIHARLMNHYSRVPEWWYALILVPMLVMSAVAIEVYDTRLPIWAFLCAVGLAFVFTIPIGIILAISNQQIELNVFAELIAGYAVPGKPLATMLFKTWSFVTMSQALQFASDMKIGHYMKIPPRIMFWAQLIAAVVAATVQLGVQVWMFGHIPDICTLTQKDGFTCPSTQVFGTASIIWGAIGPSRQFSKGQIYYALAFFFLVGAICPLISYSISRKWPNSSLAYTNFPVLFNGASYIAPASALNYVPNILVGFIFNYVIRRHRFSWWAKYNYVLSAALNSGVAISGVLIYFGLQYPANGTIGANTIQTWWGNTVYLNTADGQGLPLIALAPNETFGISYGKLTHCYDS
ncbi:uncharacterized protein FIBRA_02790 [Fibroporia radiculosa]|uniref:OPT family small oligopeptide transporter n=1 Tax=Fibroporia radiculosa TaxID=599839 RepID=J4GN45_9APHY|nr:uncharacterized protein FIBRA_02790 [Fibroporia radiculosa]CCM00750.1 predicted protein [Fibroporia radiculosa]